MSRAQRLKEMFSSSLESAKIEYENLQKYETAWIKNSANDIEK